MTFAAVGWFEMKKGGDGFDVDDEYVRGGRGPGTNDTVKRYSRGGFVMVDPSVCRLRVRLQSG